MEPSTSGTLIKAPLEDNFTLGSSLVFRLWSPPQVVHRTEFHQRIVLYFVFSTLDVSGVSIKKFKNYSESVKKF